MKVSYFDPKTDVWRSVFIKDSDPKAKQVLAIVSETPVVQSNPIVLIWRLFKLIWKRIFRSEPRAVNNYYVVKADDPRVKQALNKASVSDRRYYSTSNKTQNS